ncbi:MAG: hypothetical protein MUQ56_07830 [Thermoleophilia bacterium]|nr:hypothetical protein [Thermoleophilia bacterium]
MIARRLPLLFFLIATLGLSACGTAERSASTTEGTTPSPGPETLAADASPEDVRQAILAALENIGPVRVEATVTADMGELTNERHAEQLLDPVHGLARETISSSRGGPEQASVIGNESVRVMGEGANVQVIRSVQLGPPKGLPLPLYELPPLFLEDAQAISASLKDDGSWELVLRPQITAREAQMMAGDLGDLLIVVGPDLLPRRTERTIHYSTAGGTAGPDGTTSTWQSEQTSPQRVEYRIEPIDGLEEQDVRLALPPDYRVVQLSTELALDRPRADVTWPQYWLGPQFLDLKLYSAAFVVGDPDETTRSEQTMSVYGSSGQPPWEQSIQLITHKRQPGEPDDWRQMTEPPLPGDTTEEMTVAGRTATVHTRVVSTPVAAFVVQIVFPDVTVQITAVGLPPEAAKTVTEELREM